MKTNSKYTSTTESTLLIDNAQVSSSVDILGPFEPNDSIPQAFATGLDGGGSTTLSAFVGDGEFGDTSGDYDFFSLSADAGDTITIETFADSLGTGLDTVVGLYDSFGNLIAQDDDGGSGLDSLLSVEVNADDDYFAVVRGFGSGFSADPFTPGTGGGVGSTGDYDVEISIIDGGFTPVSEFEVSLGASDPGLSALMSGSFGNIVAMSDLQRTFLDTSSTFGRDVALDLDQTFV